MMCIYLYLREVVAIERHYIPPHPTFSGMAFCSFLFMDIYTLFCGACFRFFTIFVFIIIIYIRVTYNEDSNVIMTVTRSASQMSGSMNF